MPPWRSFGATGTPYRSLPSGWDVDNRLVSRRGGTCAQVSRTGTTND